MKLYTFRLVVMLAILFPLTAGAAGFANNELWLSPTKFKEGESTDVHAVLVNDKYDSISGLVEFLIDDQFIASYKVIDLKENGVKQVKFFWQPSSQAERILKLRLKDVEAKLKEEITNSVEIMEVVKNFKVTKDGEQIIITDSSRESGPKPDPSSSEEFDNNKSVLKDAQNMVAAIKTTSDKAEAAYNKTKEAVDRAKSTAEKTKEIVETGQGYYEKIKGYTVALGEYLKKFEPWWNRISNNNEPKRIVIIIGIVLVAYWLAKRSFRRDRYDRGYRD